jgi:hypothetical protein
VVCAAACSKNSATVRRGRGSLPMLNAKMYNKNCTIRKIVKKKRVEKLVKN